MTAEMFVIIHKVTCFTKVLFCFQGEVNVTQDNLNDFLAVAEELQVRKIQQLFFL